MTDTTDDMPAEAAGQEPVEPAFDEQCRGRAAGGHHTEPGVELGHHQAADPLSGHTFEFYVVLDLFSRYVVAYRVETRECEELARDMFARAFTRHQTTPQIVHSDGGASMRSKSVQQLFTDLAHSGQRLRRQLSRHHPAAPSRPR